MRHAMESQEFCYKERKRYNERGQYNKGGKKRETREVIKGRNGNRH
jgi:hypothetical protein